METTEQHMIDALRNDVDSHYTTANHLSLRLVEILARKIMRENPHFCNFCMAMSSWSFPHEVGTYNENLEQVRKTRELVYDDIPEFEELRDFLDEYDTYLKLTGTPMRIDNANADMVNDW